MSYSVLAKSTLDEATVQWMALGDIAEFSQTRISATELDATTFVGVDNLIADKRGRVDAQYLPNTVRLTAYEPGDVLLGNIRPYLKKIWRATNSGGCSGDVLSIRIKSHYKHLVDSRFLYYVLSTDDFFAFNMQHAKGAKMPRGSKSAILRYPIPIICPSDPKISLSIQDQIVRNLEILTELTAKVTAELAAELAARKKQYSYYRSKLFDFANDEVEWIQLGSIGEVRMCKRILKNQTQPEGDVPFYKIGTFGKKPDAFISKDIYERYKARYPFPKKGDVLISAAGTIGRGVIFDGKPAYFQDSNIVWLENDEKIVCNRYLWHFYKIAKWSLSEGGTIDRLYNDNIKKTKIPVPYPRDSTKSLKAQMRIADVLDELEMLFNALSGGLSHEIELRQKQYGHYLKLLLNFPKPNEV